MKVKTKDLKRKALDYAVQWAEGKMLIFCSNPTGLDRSMEEPRWAMYDGENCAYQTIPAYNLVAEDIIDREGISTYYNPPKCPLVGYWSAKKAHHDGHMWNLHMMEAPTRRTAAMRTYVSFKLGEEVDIPEELANG